MEFGTLDPGQTFEPVRFVSDRFINVFVLLRRMPLIEVSEDEGARRTPQVRLVQFMSIDQTGTKIDQKRFQRYRGRLEVVCSLRSR